MRTFKILPFVLLWLLLLLPAGAAGQEIRYAATIQPLAAILEEVVGEQGVVTRLLPRGASPHTFEPRPSDAAQLSQTRALFYAGPNLDKEWTAKLPVRERVEMLQLVPPGLRLPMTAHQQEEERGHQEEHGHEHEKEPGGLDPHFWTDPLTVKAMLPALAERLAELDPAGRDAYQRNARAFAAKLEQLHEQTAEILRPVQGEPVLLFHPSFQYLFRRYNLRLAGAIEPFPGREPSPKFLHDLISTTKRLQIKALFTEPQLPERPARVMAEAAGIPVYQLDPEGGQEGLRSYSEIILYNARTLSTALK